MEIDLGTRWEGELILKGPTMRDGSRYGHAGERVRARATQTADGALLEVLVGPDGRGGERWEYLNADAVYLPSYVRALLAQAHQAASLRTRLEALLELLPRERPANAEVLATIVGADVARVRRLLRQIAEEQQGELGAPPRAKIG